MSTLKRIIVSAALGVAALALAAPSYATVLVAGTGWQHDSIPAANDASTSSPLTFTVAPGTTDLFSLTDGFIPGDTYKIVIDNLITASSTFTTYTTPFNNNLGDAADFAADWLNNNFAHFQLSFKPGTYTLGIVGDAAEGAPAGFGERLDVAPIPEPATWLVMLAGFGGLGAAMRHRRRAQAMTAA
jgi:hypothetical protein